VHEEFAITTRPLHQEVHHIAARPGHPLAGLTHMGDSDLGIYFRHAPAASCWSAAKNPAATPDTAAG
jgi:sarcosine oxidase subunit beta